MKNTKRVVAAARKKKLLPEWLDRSLVISPWCLSLCTTPEMFLAEQRRMSVRPDDIRAFPQSGAQVSFFESSDFEKEGVRKAMIVTVSDEAAKCEPIQIAAMLCHEAVHVVQQVFRTIGEKHPSDEFYAYSIQAMAQGLMYEYVRQMGLQ